MKLRNIIYILAGLLISISCTSCDGEKDLVIIGGDLPIKTSTLYMVGDATPSGWSIDSPTPLEVTEDDPLVFTWEGLLNAGEIKLCLVAGSWDVPFIRPVSNGEKIGKTDITDASFKMYAGDPDNKWKVTDKGVYSLTFNLRNWTISTKFLREPDVETVEPINTEFLYLVGDATPAGWDIHNPTPLEKKSTYIFEWSGTLSTGEFKVYTASGEWNIACIKPLSDGCKINKNGVEDNNFIYVAAPDNKWKVEEAGIYRLVFNLEEYTISVEYRGEIPVDKEPIETESLFMVGDATPGGWSMDDASVFTKSSTNQYVFTWKGELVEGYMKACTERDGTFSCPFIRPSSADCEISLDGIAASDFVYTTNPDDKWKVTQAGKYEITFDLEHRTINVKSVD